MAAATETVGFDINVTGAQQSAARIDAVTKALAKAGAASNDNARAASAAGKAWTGAGEKISKVSAVLMSVDSGMGKLVGTLGRAAGAATTFSSALGGPLGLAAGGLIGAFALWSDYTATQEKKLESLTSATKKATFAAMTFDGQLKKITGARDKADLQKRLGSGAGSSAEYEAEIARLQNMNAAGIAGQSAGAINPEYRNKKQYENEERIRELEGRLANAREREKIENALRDGGNPSGAIGDDITGGAAKPAAPGQSAARNQLDQLRAAGDARKEAFSNQMAALEEVRRSYESREKESARLLLDERKRAIDDELQAARSAADQRIEMRRQEAEEAMKLEEQLAEKRRLTQQIAIDGARNVAGATTGALVKIAKGQKMSTAAFLESIGEQAIADGTFRILQGAAMLATLNPAGAAAIAAGGAEVAFGVALGAPARGSRGGGGGGSNRGAGFSSEPTTVRRPGDEGPRETRSNITVQVNTLVADERTGERVMQSIEAAHMKLGRKMAPSIVGRA
jgi:hypothetical protein